MSRAFDLLVLDKDGVLLDFHHLWLAVTEARVLALCAATRRPELAAPLQRLLGLDAEGRARPDGLLVAGTRAESELAAAALLHQHGLGWPEARATARAAYAQADGAIDRAACSRPLPGAVAAVRALAAAGHRLAIATTDTTGGARAFLSAHGLAEVFSSVVGADRVALAKPDAEMFLLACAEAGVPPARAAMVGDAPVDLAMGRAAGAGAVIGVLSGVGTALELASADVLVADLAALAAEPGYK